MEKIKKVVLSAKKGQNYFTDRGKKFEVRGKCL
jgi:hypothetical protein